MTVCSDTGKVFEARSSPRLHACVTSGLTANIRASYFNQSLCQDYGPHIQLKSHSL